MKILREYVWDTVRKNKRTSLAIIIALFLMTTLMSCVCGFFYTMWTDAVQMSKWENGDWHGELFDITYGKDLEHIENYASVSAVMIKGNWEVARLDESGKRNYLISRGANDEYWNSMPEKDILIQGQRPRSENEIALSKQYFDNHPDIKIGDTLTLPVGKRILDGEVLSETEGYHENETFRQTGTKTYKIVGKMDMTTSSSVPAYTGISYLDEKNILPEDEITVYLRFAPMRNTYKELPALAASIGYKTDEYGAYNLRYNTELLSKYAIFSSQQLSTMNQLSALAFPLMILVVAIMLVGLFVLVIHNAFALSANEKLSQLGTLSGIGASPRQIKSAVISEALILTIFPLPLGIISGWLLDMKLFQIINANNDIGRTAPDIALSFGLPAILPAIFLSLLTVWLSALIPGRKIAKLLPVEALRLDNRIKKKHLPKSRITSRLGITGELAANAVSARKHSYRTATISLCLSFLLLTGFLYIYSTQNAAQNIYQSGLDNIRHIQFNISDGRTPDMEVLEKVKQIPGITKTTIYNKLPCATWITDQDASEDMETYFGGFDEIAARKKYSTIERDGKYRISTTLIGLEDDSFREYCRQLGIDPEPYLKDASRAIIYNYTEDPDVSTRKNSVMRELLSLRTDQEITFTERAYDEDTGDYTFRLTAGALAKKLPDTGLKVSRFTLTAIMPMDHVLEIGAFCSSKRKSTANSINALLLTDSTKGISYPRIQKVSDQVETLLTRYYGTGDYLITDLAMLKEMDDSETKIMNLIVTFLTGLLAVIGLSNVWASISGNLRQRRKEFGMLKSAGLSPRQLWKMLFLEGITLGLKPLLLSIPFQVIILSMFLWINEVTLPEYLPYAPFVPILGYTLLVLLAIIGAYFLGGRKIQKDNIITSVKDDTI